MIKVYCDICGKDRGELTTVFQFDHIDIGRKNKYTPCDFSYNEVRDTLIKWQNFSATHELLYMLFTDNHDQPWYISRVGSDKELRYETATLLATMTFLLRGIPFIFQGQEIGSANSQFDDISSFCDVETLQYFHEHKAKLPKEILMQKINFSSRDNARRPFAWNGEKNRGFTTAKTPWLGFGTRSEEINVENDLRSEKSVLVSLTVQG